ncbi:hypothetical protein Goarm_007824, partial [Gossypium armourianum]|nr:hypothetical protein [Gossypium armourianum]
AVKRSLVVVVVLYNTKLLSVTALKTFVQTVASKSSDPLLTP